VPQQTTLDFIASSPPGTACCGSGILLDTQRRETMWYIRMEDDWIAELPESVLVGFRAMLFAREGVLAAAVCLCIGPEEHDNVYATWLYPYGTLRGHLENLQHQARVLVHLVGDDGQIATTVESENPMAEFAEEVLMRAGSRQPNNDEVFAVRDYYRSQIGEPIAWRIWNACCPLP
jgi:hypothetical protein